MFKVLNTLIQIYQTCCHYLNMVETSLSLLQNKAVGIVLRVLCISYFCSVAERLSVQTWLFLQYFLHFNIVVSACQRIAWVPTDEQSLNIAFTVDVTSRSK